jgi:hypothetical protein
VNDSSPWPDTTASRVDGDLADSPLIGRAGGLLILSAAGQQRESSLAFAGLLQLLRPILPELLTLPGRRAEELRAAIGLAPQPPTPTCC